MYKDLPTAAFTEREEGINAREYIRAEAVAFVEYNAVDDEACDGLRSV